MGNRAVITTNNNLQDLGVYVHWNGGRDSVTAFLTYCKLQGFRAPEQDNYGWARLCQVLGNFFGKGGTCVGIDVANKLDTDNFDNGTFIIKDWKVVDVMYSHGTDNSYDLKEFLDALNGCQPEESQLTDEEIYRGLITLCREGYFDSFDGFKPIGISFFEAKGKEQKKMVEFLSKYNEGRTLARICLFGSGKGKYELVDAEETAEFIKVFCSDDGKELKDTFYYLLAEKLRYNHAVKVVAVDELKKFGLDTAEEVRQVFNMTTEEFEEIIPARFFEQKS